MVVTQDFTILFPEAVPCGRQNIKHKAETFPGFVLVSFVVETNYKNEMQFFGFSDLSRPNMTKKCFRFVTPIHETKPSQFFIV
jgi:hypothetical protein